MTQDTIENVPDGDAYEEAKILAKEAVSPALREKIVGVLSCGRPPHVSILDLADAIIAAIQPDAGDAVGYINNIALAHLMSGRYWTSAITKQPGDDYSPLFTHPPDAQARIASMEAELAALKIENEQIRNHAGSVIHDNVKLEAELAEIKGSMAYRNSLFCRVEAERDTLRKRLHDVETLCDPAGLVAQNTQSQDQLRELQVMYRNAADERDMLRKDATEMCAVALVIEQLEDNEARVSWLFNPVPEGQELLWNHGGVIATQSAQAGALSGEEN